MGGQLVDFTEHCQISPSFRFGWATCGNHLCSRVLVWIDQASYMLLVISLKPCHSSPRVVGSASVKKKAVLKG